jgi:hypothetical protein
MKKMKIISPLQTITASVLLMMGSTQTLADTFNVTGGSLTTVNPIQGTVTGISQFDSVSGSVTLDVSNFVTGGTLTGDSGLLQIDYLDSFFDPYAVGFFGPYSWDLGTGQGTGSFGCSDSDGGVTCSGFSSTDWDFNGYGVTSLIDNASGVDDVLEISTYTSRGDTLNWTLTGNLSAVPVPAAVWLFGSGLLGLTGIARRRRSQSV